MSSSNKRRKCTFNSDLETKYPFLRSTNKDKTEVYCEKCASQFSVSNSSKSDIENYIKTDKHKKASIAKSSDKRTEYFSKKQFCFSGLF